MARASRISTERLLYALLVFVPVCVALRFAAPGTAVAIFATACLAIVPLAYLMGQATEVLASRVGAGLGGLLNATFGNAAELIIALVALAKGKVEIVKASLTGSIIGNILFILGLAMVAGGAPREEQRFNPTAAAAGSILLFLAVLGLLIPTLFAGLVGNAVPNAESIAGTLSVVISGVLLALYLLSLWFSLRTHRHLYDDEEEAVHSGPSWGVRRALVVLTLSAAAVGFVSEILVGAIEDTIVTLGFTETFVGVVILAMVGNAAEHSTAVLMAVRNRMAIAFQIAVESSKQVALLVAPVCVFVGLALGQPMDLHFTGFEVLAVGASVVIVHVAAQDGRSNWLEGAALLSVYVIFGAALYFVP
jgi:Ca2+:H+ antiporter